jgi:hypothetical protein
LNTSNFFQYKYPPTTEIISAEVKRSSLTEDVKAGSDSTNPFTIVGGETCILKININECFNFGHETDLSKSYYNLFAKEFKFTGKGYLRQIPKAFLCKLFTSSQKLTRIEFDTSGWMGVETIGDYFMLAAFAQYPFPTSVVPDTSNWNVTSIGTYFMAGTFGNSPLLTNFIPPNTLNWPLKSVGNYFFSQTFNANTYLRTATLPDASNWNLTIKGNNFMAETFTNAFNSTGSGSSGVRILTIHDNTAKPVYTTGLSTNSMSIDDTRIDNIYVPSSLVSTYQGAPNWSNITESKFATI